MRNLLLIVFLVIGLCLFAQEGKVRGLVLDDFIGTPIAEATVSVESSDVTDVSDLDGAFSIDLPVGVYTIKVSAEGYEDFTVQEVQVLSGEVTALNDIFLVESLLAGDEIQLQNVVVTGQAQTNTEEAILRMKKRSPVIFDGISASRLELTGDANAVQAAKRVTGVSVEDGKYVYVRGLGDRYTKTTLNGIQIPGLDPDRNTIQMDIFPSDILNNLLVNKTFSAELPADFTGGLVNIETKDFPKKKFLNVSVGFGFNPQANLTNDYISYQGSQTDFLGFDDGQRDLPVLARVVAEVEPFFPVPLPGSSPDQQVFDFANSFDPNMAATNQTSLLNSNFSVSYGDQFNLKSGNDLGVLFSVNYSNEYLLFDEAFFGNFVRDGTDSSQNELILASSQDGVQAEHNVSVGILGGLSFKTKNSKYSLTGTHLQSGSSRAGEFALFSSNIAAGQSGFEGVTDNLEYSERSLSNALLSGEHKLNGDWKIDWKLSATASIADDPDIRRTPFTQESSGDFVFSSGEAGLPFRVWRFLDEYLVNPTLDIEKKYQLFNNDAKLKFGGNFAYKNRDYEILAYSLQFTGTPADQTWASPDPNLVFQDENLFPNGGAARGFITAGQAGGFDANGVSNNANAYEADSELYAAYVSNEFQISPEFKAILGLRMERFTAFHTGRSADNTQVLDNAEVLNSTDLFPSANFIYSLTDDMNLRAVYSRTIARPSFKELSFAAIVDPFKDRIFLGGLNAIGNWDGNLSETYINNIDLRWEYFLGRGELLSVSGFYKSFSDPIELVRLAEAQTTVQYQPRNVGDGTVIGIELEAVKNLGFISNFFENFLLTANYTLLDSQIDMSDAELSTRRDGLRDGEVLEDTRQMVGQSPFVVNAGLIFNNKDAALETGLFYNVRGRTLSVVGTGLVPDVYDRPFHDMSYTLRKSFGKERNLTVDFKVSNILNDERESVFDSFLAQDQLYERINPNRTFSLGVGYKF